MGHREAAEVSGSSQLRSEAVPAALHVALAPKPDNLPVCSADLSTLFETQRLVVRRITAEDLEPMYSVYSDADAMRFVGEGTPITREACVRWVGVTLANYEARGYGMSAIALKQGLPIIGFCGLVHPSGQTTPEIKYALSREQWGQGYATETVSAMLGYGMKTLGLARIIATIHADNGALPNGLSRRLV